MKHRLILVSVCLLACITLSSHRADEGMFPLSQLDKVNFRQAGFKISQADIFNPEGTSLTDALVRLGGCTGSFVSAEGLIVTNHHCVFGSVANISTKENDYLENGFVAADRSKELRTGLTCRITQSYKDVSTEVLKGINDDMPADQRAARIAENIAQIVKAESAANPKLTVEVSEMFTGKNYTLFRYKTLRDVRLVYVPPRTIGEFGGETDNWEWPRHNGDFSFVRAYVGPDGEPADYNTANVPYKPKKHLQINPAGTKENDLVFILGYPGATFRHEPSQFIAYQQEYQLPFISEWYGWRINTMEELGKTDRNRYLRMAGTIKGLANTKKNYLGKIQGLRRTHLIETKQAEEARLIEALKSNPADYAKYAPVFKRIDSLYSIKMSTARHDMLLNRFGADLGMLSGAVAIANIQKQLRDIRAQKQEIVWSKVKDATKNALKQSYRAGDIELEQILFTELANRAKALPANQDIKAVEQLGSDASGWIQQTYSNTIFAKPEMLNKLVDSLPEQLESLKDPLLDFALRLQPEFEALTKQQVSMNEQLNALLPQMLEVKQKYGNKLFIPDANSTLRLTYGYIKGYNPDDGVYNSPYTSVKGILEKNNSDNIDYRVSNPVAELYKTKKISKTLVDPKTGQPVVCLLYNLDTTGGNSGSPVMDASGRLIGINFDRSYTATLNDYSWNSEYSRSIAVDIRYVLYVMKYLNGADHLISELGVKLK